MPSTKRKPAVSAAKFIPAVNELLLRKRGIMLDVGCGESKQSGMVGLDIRPLPGVDLVWDLEQVPYPLPDECCISILASHVVEHIQPARFGFVNVMNEWWRLMKPGGRLMIALPYGVNSRFVQDPSHCNPCNEVTWAYFAPEHQSQLWRIYQPKPWRIVVNCWHAHGDMEVILEKLLLPEASPERNGHAAPHRRKRC